MSHQHTTIVTNLRKAVILAFSSVIWLGGISTAFAADLSPEAAALKEEGAAAFGKKDWPTALERFERAYEISKDPSLLYNQARTLESSLELPRALDKILEFERLASPELKARVTGLSELIASIRDRVVTLRIRSNVADAEIRIGDRVVGKTQSTETLVRINRGVVKVSLVKEGYFPCSDALLDLKPAETRIVTCELASRNTRGFLRLESTAGTSVKIDGTDRGIVPFEGDLTAGTHSLELSRAQYETYRSSFLLAAGEHKQIKQDLMPSPGITSRWWFWTAIGVVVVGGAVVATAVALNTEADTNQGSIRPGFIRTNGFAF